MSIRRNNPGTDWFTTGGIIVNEKNIAQFDHKHDLIIKECFINNNVVLPKSFKLHYHELRRKSPPYNKMSINQCKQVADRMFDAINTVDCKLVSVSLNKSSHAAQYGDLAMIRAYTLLVALERFQYFLEDHNDQGKVIYERFNRSIRHRMEIDMKNLKEIPGFPHLADLGNIRGKIIDGNPFNRVDP